ncbi:unnamed protein product, partial [marine sediment metagenome]
DFCTTNCPYDYCIMAEAPRGRPAAEKNHECLDEEVP